jgi:uncharacterized membrane protein HdeD (DUF308 family)
LNQARAALATDNITRLEGQTMTMAMPQISELSSNWWALALRGAVGILLGLLAFTMPGVTIAAIVTLFGLYAFVDGVLAVMAAIRGVREHDRWGWMLLQGIAGIAAGVFVFFVPAGGALALVWLVAAWAVVTGALEIGAAYRLRRLIADEWMLLFAGFLSVALGFLIAARPGIGLAVIVTWIGVYALLSGVALLVLAFRIKKWTHEHA